ncbi:hypothetical protein JXA63_05585 [Candidatus Woesebacteria bacterium]|nr:hypothetical protein [Candidatus Woesebacteria bacterium]
MKIIKKLAIIIKRILHKLPRIEVKIIDIPVENKPTLIQKLKSLKKGRSFSYRSKKAILKILSLWVIPVLLAVGSFLMIRPVMAQISEDPGILLYLFENDPEVGAETVGDNLYPQIYYVYNGNKVFITDTQYTNAKPHSNGEWVTWMSEIDGRWQIFLHNILAETTVQLTRGGNNVNPKVSEGNVTWEGWSEPPLAYGSGNWQIFVYTGEYIKQITQGWLSISPAIEGDYIAYIQKNANDLWDLGAYSIKDDKIADLALNIVCDHIEIKDNFVSYGETCSGTTKFPLKLEEVFLLELTPLSTLQQKQDELMDQLENIIQQTPIPDVRSATDEATPATSSATPILEPTLTTTPIPTVPTTSSDTQEATNSAEVN